MSADAKGIKERVRAAITSGNYPTKTVLSSLLAAQDELGYLPDAAIEEVAVQNETTTNEVWGVASFYTNFRFSPPGKHLIEVCWGPSCHLAGSSDVIDAIQNELGISSEGEARNNQVSLKYNTCLGACAQSPVASIDHQLYGRLTPESALDLLSNNMED